MSASLGNPTGRNTKSHRESQNWSSTWARENSEELTSLRSGLNEGAVRKRSAFDQLQYMNPRSFEEITNA